MSTARPARWWRVAGLPMGAAVEVEVWAYVEGAPVRGGSTGYGVQVVCPNR